MTVAVVILNYNGKHFLTRFLPSVVSFSKGHQVIVADNGSDDGSAELIENNFPDVKLIRINGNKGYTGGYNEALKQVAADTYVLVNTDIEVTEGWIHPIIELMSRDNSIAACQPKLLSYDNKNKFEYAGAAGGYIDFLGFPFCRGRLFQNMEEDAGQYNDIKQIFWASGACLFIKSDVFHQLGGFDEDFFAHMEEIDLCWRIQNAGYKIYYNGSSTVYHVGGGTLSASNPKKTYFNFRNGLSMFVKNEDQGKLWWKLPLRASFDSIAFFKFLFQDSIADAMAVFKAHFHFWFDLKKTIGKRKFAKSNWLVPRQKNDQIYQKSIVINYFLNRKKKFTDLEF